MSKLVTDRTESDVRAGNAKGFYNAADLNRVEAAAADAAARLAPYGYLVRPVIRTDWAPGELPAKAGLDRYLENVRQIARVFTGDAQLPETMEYLTWKGANAIERTLEMVEELVPEMTAAFRPSGTFSAGE